MPDRGQERPNRANEIVIGDGSGERIDLRPPPLRVTWDGIEIQRPNPEELPELLDVPTIARVTGLSKRKVEQLMVLDRSQGGFPVVKVGGRTYVRKDDLSSWIEGLEPR